ncbi:hypothetical protein [Paenibacillus typhae]|uniref:hypothetical protein n=1 Tax=Paenibacillus typhae TaxID=1174501 RepID=UPI001C8F0198|nr:hypothetical protein [Paenibacillus typhae]MBY0010506.1 hypothetical protein [Paenibacillus typhae]
MIIASCSTDVITLYRLQRNGLLSPVREGCRTGQPVPRSTAVATKGSSQSPE